jgi:hypothetical protein
MDVTNFSDRQVSDSLTSLPLSCKDASQQGFAYLWHKQHTPWTRSILNGRPNIFVREVVTRIDVLKVERLVIVQTGRLAMEGRPR